MGHKIYLLHHFMRSGGVERQLYYVANGLAVSNQVTVMLCQREGSFLQFLDKDVSVLDLDIPFRNRLQPGLLARIMTILRKDRPDVLISFHGSFHWMAVIAGRLLGVKTVCVFHGYLTKGLLWAAQRFFLEKADGLLAVSQSVKNGLTENLGVVAAKITLIENGIDAEKIRQMSAAALGGDEQQYFKKGPVIISIGRLAKGKGFGDILDAVAGIEKSYTLLLIGDGPEKHALQEHIERLGLSDRVHMLGNQVNPYKLLARASFLVLASETEGLPTVILEAMSLGIPCICARYLGGTEGVIAHKENGFLVNPNDPVSLREAIELFLSSQSRALQDTMAREGMRLVEEKFTMSRYLSDYERYLAGIAKR